VAKAEQGTTNRWLVWSTGVVAVLSLAASAALATGLWESRHMPYVADVSGGLAKHNFENETLSMSHMSDLQAESFAALRLPAIMALIALTLGPLSAYGLRLRRRHYEATWTLACAMAVLLVAASVAYARFEPYLSSKNLAQAIARQIGPEDTVAVYGDQSN